MEIISNVKALLNKPDEFVKKNTKEVLIYTLALKVLALIAILLNPFFLYGTYLSVSFLSLSLLVDYKIVRNIEYVAYYLFYNYTKKDPYEVGNMAGHQMATLYKTYPNIKWWQLIKGYAVGFYTGYKN
ncbi:MAG: hypothetical protein JXA94_05195 [Parachlamydiales bacterium]|nr:hypothetical protein [Parachlamydiales bacterium]